MQITFSKSELEIFLNAMEVASCEYTKLAHTEGYNEATRSFWQKRAGEISGLIGALRFASAPSNGGL